MIVNLQVYFDLHHQHAKLLAKITMNITMKEFNSLDKSLLEQRKNAHEDLPFICQKPK